MLVRLKARPKEQQNSLGHSIRQGNLSGEHSHKVKRIMGMLHGPRRPPLWSTGGLPEWLKASEGKVTLPWEFAHFAHGPHLPYREV